MNAPRFDGLARHASYVVPCRRLPLTAVGAAGVASYRPSLAQAGKDARNACKRQVDQCESSVTSFCADLLVLAPEGCEAAFRPCYASFENCQAGEF